MTKDPLIFVRHIIESIEKIEEYTQGMSEHEFQKSIVVQDAVIRRLEIAGEAAKNISPAFQKKHPDIPWSAMARTRDKLIHGYFGVDIALTWQIIKKDLPGVKKALLALLK
jgi:uncharacterized protein with HEPN domain